LNKSIQNKTYLFFPRINTNSHKLLKQKQRKQLFCKASVLQHGYVPSTDIFI